MWCRNGLLIRSKISDVYGFLTERNAYGYDKKTFLSETYCTIYINKMKNIKITHFRNSSRIYSTNSMNRVKIDIPDTHLLDRSLSWLSTGT
jgi:hypothetical protein